MADDFLKAPTPQEAQGLTSGLTSIVETIGGLFGAEGDAPAVDVAAIERAKQKRLLTMAALGGVVILVVWKLSKKR